LIEYTQGILGKELSTLDVDRNLNEIPFRKLLLLHDKKDKILPFSNSENIHKNVERVTLEPLEGIGHYRMLWNDDVIKKVKKSLGPVLPDDIGKTGSNKCYRVGPDRKTPLVVTSASILLVKSFPDRH